MPQYALEDIIVGGLTPVPANRYTVRFTKAEYKTAQVTPDRPNPKPTLRCEGEILCPAEIEHAGQRYALRGRKIYFMPQSIDPNVGWGLGRVVEALKKVNFDFQKFGAGGGIDTDRLPLLIAGLTFDCWLTSHEEFSTLGDGTVLKDAEGRPYSRGWKVDVTWDSVLGPATGDLSDVDPL